jgi:hypothetical protein
VKRERDGGNLDDDGNQSTHPPHLYLFLKRSNENNNWNRVFLYYCCIARVKV